MIAVIPVNGPTGAATILGGFWGAMEIILHGGAHRTGTTSFQKYLREGRRALRSDGTWVWGPRHLRGGMLEGVFSTKKTWPQAQTIDRVAAQISMIQHAGAKRLLVSDENMIGAPFACLRAGALYPLAGQRISRMAQALGGRIKRIVLTIRAQDLWWSSIAAFAVARGASTPSASKLEAIACSRRTWRDVISDISQAIPDARFDVVAFDDAVGQHDWLLSVATARRAPIPNRIYWVNQSADLQKLRHVLKQRNTGDVLPFGEGRWNPFTAAQSAALREAYADDIMWLRSGANGLATLTESPSRDKMGVDPAWIDMTRGSEDDDQAEQRFTRRLAGSG